MTKTAYVTKPTEKEVDESFYVVVPPEHVHEFLEFAAPLNHLEYFLVPDYDRKKFLDIEGVRFRAILDSAGKLICPCCGGRGHPSRVQ